MGIPVDRYTAPASSRPRPTHSAKPSWSEPAAPYDYPLSSIDGPLLPLSGASPMVRHPNYHDENLPLSALAFVPPSSLRGASPAPFTTSNWTGSDDTRVRTGVEMGTAAGSANRVDIESPLPSRTSTRAHPSVRRVTRSPAFVASSSTTTSRAGAGSEAETDGIELQPSSNLWPSQWLASESGRGAVRDFPSASLTNHLTRSPNSSLISVSQRNEHGNVEDTTSRNTRLVNTNHTDNRDRVDLPGRQGADAGELPEQQGRRVNQNGTAEGSTGEHEGRTASPPRSPSPSSLQTPSPNALPYRTVVRAHPRYERVVQIFPEDHEPIYMYGRPARSSTSTTSSSSTMWVSDYGVASSVTSANGSSS